MSVSRAIDMLSTSDHLVEARRIASAHGVELDDMLSKKCSKATRLNAARVELYRHLVSEGWSYTRIAELRDVDHTTIIHTLRYAEDTAWRESRKRSARARDQYRRTRALTLAARARVLGVPMAPEDHEAEKALLRAAEEALP